MSDNTKVMKTENELLEEIHNLKTELADYNASAQGWKACFEGEKERHKVTQNEFEKVKNLANEYIDLLNQKEILILELSKGIVRAITH